MDGYYRYLKIDPDTQLQSRQGLFRIESGELSILEDPRGILKRLLKQGPVTQGTIDVMRSGLHSPYFLITKDNDPELDKQYQVPINNEGRDIDKENSEKAKVIGTVKLEALRNMLEKEDSDVEVDIPEHLVIQNGSWRWDG